jgi:hypothetical protein
MDSGDPEFHTIPVLTSREGKLVSGRIPPGGAEKDALSVLTRQERGDYQMGGQSQS